MPTDIVVENTVRQKYGEAAQRVSQAARSVPAAIEKSVQVGAALIHKHMRSKAFATQRSELFDVFHALRSAWQDRNLRAFELCAHRG
ncbi:MAG: hypothetical protein Q7J47_11425 [Azoarcus sp.]|nr:hypothetical protein [Azoarcus sp.]